MAMEYQLPVAQVIGDRLWMTVAVSVAALIFTWLVALPIGIYSAVRQRSILDYVFTFIGFIGLAIPNFLLALLVLYFGFKYFNANIGGLFKPEFADAPWSWAKFQDLLGHMPIPAIVLGMAATAAQIRIMRANLLDEKRKPYVVSARVRGLPEYRVILKYPVRVALNPFASTIGYTLPYIVSGSVIVSIVLSLPTVGPLLFKALIALDMFLAGTIILMLGVLTVIGTLLSDLLLMWLDPRIRLKASAGSEESPQSRPGPRNGPHHRSRGAHLGRAAVAAHVVALPQAQAGARLDGPGGALLYGGRLRRLSGVFGPARLGSSALAHRPAGRAPLRRGPPESVC